MKLRYGIISVLVAATLAIAFGALQAPQETSAAKIDDWKDTSDRLDPTSLYDAPPAPVAPVKQTETDQPVTPAQPEPGVVVENENTEPVYEVGAEQEVTSPEPAVTEYWIQVTGYCHLSTIEQDCAQATVDSHHYSYISYGMTDLVTIAAHEDPVIASLQVGDIVNTNYGRFKVEYDYWAPKDIRSDKVPGGTAFQTCVGESMRFVYATPI